VIKSRDRASTSINSLRSYNHNASNINGPYSSRRNDPCKSKLEICYILNVFVIVYSQLHSRYTTKYSSSNNFFKEKVNAQSSKSCKCNILKLKVQNSNKKPKKTDVANKIPISAKSFRTVKPASKSVVEFKYNEFVEEPKSTHITNQSFIKIDNNISIISKDSIPASRRDNKYNAAKNSFKGIINEVKVSETNHRNLRAFSYPNKESNDCYSDKKSENECVSGRGSPILQDISLLLPYLTTGNKELDQINENTGELFLTESMGDTHKNFDSQTFSNYDLTADYKPNSGDEDNLISVKSSHNRKTCEYFR
jgi:hypothetical protein